MGLEHRASGAFEDIYPVHTLDDIKSNRTYVDWLMVFNDVLDAKKLNDALSRLLDIGDWKKLGGRLRFRGNGKLEIQSSSITGQPNVFFTHDAFDVAIQEHPVAGQIPKATEAPSIQPIADDFRPFIARPNFPTFEELVRQKLPPISLHITTFSDATIVALVWPHLLMDASGVQALLAAWSSVLAGREGEVPMVLGARTDILRKAASTDGDGMPEEFELERKRLKGTSLLKFYLRIFWNRIWEPRRQRRIVFLPRSALTRMRTRVQQEIAESNQALDHTPFVSDGDIITAWITQAAASSEPKETRPVTVYSVLNARFRIPQLRKGVFIQNMALGTCTFLPVQLAHGPIGSIALSHRQHVLEQGKEKQIFGFLRRAYQDIEKTGIPKLFFGESHALLMLFNNVTKIEVMKAVNFGPAVLSQGEIDETRKNPLGTMVTYYNETLFVDPSFNALNLFVIHGKDYGGNYWCMGNLLPRTWEKIEEGLSNV
ncbi:hypothetical protein N7474_004133 [Penicillium riverlandense]|uniref:uncharacterized protein n=1 Tax=Penicillium riverlandense TaxID=1903569 RepID=UPI002548A31B|nr:uncharacterized protein N7474_004133 [Penicillium riverlandense]KAJ5818542.1 hypothetical protein N7474_004133 [Penicillium riverlandense]